MGYGLLGFSIGQSWKTSQRRPSFSEADVEGLLGKPGESALQVEGIADVNTQRLNSRKMLGMLSEGEKCGRFKVCRHCRSLVDLGLYGLSHKDFSFYFERNGESLENCEQRRGMI